MKKHSKTKIVVVGGGAGGLELVARLCKTFKNKKCVEIILIDKQLKHIWKPLLHQVAAGTYSFYHDEIDYINYAYQKGFKFLLGTVFSIDEKNKNIVIDSHAENTQDMQLPKRKICYDILVMAVGAQSNDFNIPGVKEHCLLLDSVPEAEYFHKILVEHIVKATQEIKLDAPHKINICIVGGGATGVELAAELNYVLSEINQHANQLRNPCNFQITVIETGDRLLNMMPERISEVVTHYLIENNINILNRTEIVSVAENGLTTFDGRFIESSITIWAAGVKSNSLLGKHLLELNHLHQFVVSDTLQTTRDESIFAFGDCASCQQMDRSGKVYYVPPRAQAAYQQAKFLVEAIKNHLAQKPLPVYHYRDYGSLITLSRFNVVGNLMARVAKNFYIEGVLARLTYWFLYKRHLMVLKGIKYVVISAFVELMMRNQQSKIKLH